MSPLHLWEKRELVTQRRRRPVGPDKMPLPLQQVYAMTRDVKKMWPASLEKVAVDLEDDLRRRGDQQERELIEPGLRKGWSPWPK